MKKLLLLLLSTTAAFASYAPGAKLKGSSSGQINILAPASPTSYNVVMPSAQGAANTILRNDGSGNLSWVLGGGSGLSVGFKAMSASPTIADFTTGSDPMIFPGLGTFGYDTNSAYNTTTGEYTIPTTGKYHFDASVSMQLTSATVNFQVAGQLAINGTVFATNADFITTATGSYTGAVQAIVTADIDCTAGDVITFLPFTNTNTGTSFEATESKQFFEAHLISGGSGTPTMAFKAMSATPTAASFGSGDPVIFSSLGTYGFDTDGGYNTTTGLYTTPVGGDGIWQFTCALGINATNPSNGAANLYLVKNGGLSVAFIRAALDAGNTLGNPIVTALIDVVAGDTIQCNPESNGTSPSFQAYESANYFEGHLISGGGGGGGSGATIALDNLASVAINTSLISDTHATDDLGSDSIEWKDLWIRNIKHSDSGSPMLTISTNSDNGAISLLPNGTGNVIAKSIIPLADNTYDLGDASTYWDQIFANKVNSGASTLLLTGGPVVINSSLNTLAPFGPGSGQTGNLHFQELAANGTDTVGFVAPDSISTSVAWKLPGADGLAGQVIKTSGAGVLSFVHPLVSTGSAPSATVQGSAGTGGTCTISSDATDWAGQVTVGTGTIGLSTGSYCQLGYALSHSGSMVCMLTPASATLSSSTYVTSTTSTMDINFALAGGVTSTYVINYHCIETQ